MKFQIMLIFFYLFSITLLADNNKNYHESYTVGYDYTSELQKKNKDVIIEALFYCSGFPLMNNIQINLCKFGVLHAESKQKKFTYEEFLKYDAISLSNSIINSPYNKF